MKQKNIELPDNPYMLQNIVVVGGGGWDVRAGGDQIVLSPLYTPSKPSSPNSTELLTTCLPSITSGLKKFTSLFYNIHVNAKNLMCLTYMYFV